MKVYFYLSISVKDVTFFTYMSDISFAKFVFQYSIKYFHLNKINLVNFYTSTCIYSKQIYPNTMSLFWL